MHCLLPLIASPTFFVLLPYLSFFSLPPQLLFLTFVSVCLSGSLVYFNRLVLLPCFIPSPSLSLYLPEHSPRLSPRRTITLSVHFVPFTTHHLPPLLTCDTRQRWLVPSAEQRPTAAPTTATQRQLKENLQGYYATATTLETHHSQRHWPLHHSEIHHMAAFLLVCICLLLTH